MRLGSQGIQRKLVGWENSMNLIKYAPQTVQVHNNVFCLNIFIDTKNLLKLKMIDIQFQMHLKFFLPILTILL